MEVVTDKNFFKIGDRKGTTKKFRMMSSQKPLIAKIMNHRFGKAKY